MRNHRLLGGKGGSAAKPSVARAEGDDQHPRADRPQLPTHRVPAYRRPGRRLHGRHDFAGTDAASARSSTVTRALTATPFAARSRRAARCRISRPGRTGAGRTAFHPSCTAIGTPCGTSEEQDIAALASLIGNLWKRRALWSREGANLSVNLPKELPAEAGLATIGRDKIAGAADVKSDDDERIVWRIRRGRPHTSRPSDENSLIDRGRIAIVRHCWVDGAPLLASFATELTTALSPAPVATAE